VASLRKRFAGVMVRDLESELLLLDTEADQIHKLNRTASFIWRHVGEADSPATLAGLVAQEFDVEEHVALRDVVDTLKRFMALNLVLEG
jgi:Coenzyme PQQ synthesis protein D (PqqD)